MFPKINIANIQSKDDIEITSLGKCFKFDFEKGQHIIIDGKFVECEVVENIQQFIQLVLRTNTNKFKVYTEDETENFGLSIHNYIGVKKYPKGFIFSEAKREITEQLLNHSFIKAVNNFDFKFEHTVLIITFDCELQNDDVLNINEVIDIGF